MSHSSRRTFLRLSLAAAAAGAAGACVVGEEFQRGYIIDERAVAQVRPGMNAEQVLQTLGSPSTVSTVGNQSWYYISQVTRRRAQFMSAQVVDQRVTAVYFKGGRGGNLTVERVALYGLQDGKIFDFISRSTPTGGQDASFLGQVFKGVTSFNPF